MKFDSPEERHYYNWLIELQDLGYIKEIQSQPEYEIFTALSLDFNGKSKSVMRKMC